MSFPFLVTFILTLYKVHAPATLPLLSNNRRCKLAFSFIFVKNFIICIVRSFDTQTIDLCDLVIIYYYLINIYRK